MDRAKTIRNASVLLLATCLALHAQQYEWKRLGATKTAQMSTSGYISADSNAGTFCAVQFRVEGGEIELQHVTVHFGNSQTQQASVQYKIPAGSISPAIALPGLRRSIKGVDFLYTLSSPARPATVMLWGNMLKGEATCSH